MKTLKKSLAMLLALVMSLGCMSVGAWATDGENEIHVATAEELRAAEPIATGKTVIMDADITLEAIEHSGYDYSGNKQGIIITGGTLNGNGHKLSLTGSGDTKTIVTTGGTIQNLTIDSGFRGISIWVPTTDVVLDNVTLDTDCYGLNTAETGNAEVELIVTNSTLKGWSSYSGNYSSIVFADCSFSKDTDGYGYSYVRPYCDTTFTNCQFSADSEIGDNSENLTYTFTNCTKDGKPLTKETFIDSGIIELYDNCTKSLSAIVNYAKYSFTTEAWTLLVAQIGNEYYTTLAEAIDAAQDGDTVTLLKSADISTRFNISKSMTIDGDGLTNATIKIDDGDNRVFDISNQENVTFTLKKVYADGSESGISSTAYARGVSLYSNKNVKLVLDDASVSSPYYAINIAGANEGVDVEMKNASASAGWAALNAWSPMTINVTDSTLSGLSDKTYNADGWNNFGTIVMNYQDSSVRTTGSNLIFDNTTIKGETKNGNRQVLVDFRDDGITTSFTACTFESIGVPDGFNDLMFLICENEKMIFNGCTFKKNETELTAKQVMDGYFAFYDGNDPRTSTIVFDGVQFFYVDNSNYCRADYATLATNENREFIGGLFYDDPSAYVADGYAAVKQDNGTWKVGPVSSASTEIITTGKDTYTVTTTVKESKEPEAEVLSESSASVSVQPETVAAAEVKTTETVSLANIDTKAVAETAAAMVVADNVEGVTDINVTISLKKETPTEEATLKTTYAAAEVFEVHPEATYVATYTDANNDTQITEAKTFTVANADLEGSFTFNLYLDSEKYGTGVNALKAGDLVTVTHYKDDNTTEIWNKKVQSDDNGLYVELTLSSFSHVAVKANSDPNATVDYTVKIADATSGTAVIYPGDSVTMDVTVSGDDFYGGDFTIEYDNTAFDLGEQSFATGINPQNSRSGWETGKPADKAWVNYNLVNSGARLADGSKIFSVTFTAKSELTETDTYDFKVVDARVNYDNTKNADIVESQYRLGDKVTVNATQYTVTFDGESHDWEYSVYEGKGVDTIPTDVQTGYTFKGWASSSAPTTALTADAIRNAAVTAAVTYVPVFEAEQYDVTLSGATGDTKATFGQDYTATISDYDANNYDYTVTYKSGTDASKTLTPNSATVTIPAADITGELNVTVEKTLKGFDVELHADYVTGYTLVLVKKSATNAATTSPIYTYGASGENTGAMFFVKELTKADESKAYGAYAILVEGAITESAARAKVGITATAATELTIQTDVNATGLIDSSDLQAAFSGYKVQLTLPEQMAIYLRADVNGDYKLDTADVGLVNSARAQ